MKKVIVFVAKVFFLWVLFLGYNLILSAYDPIFTNELAMQQMQNTDTSSSGIAIYSYVKNYTYVMFLITGILLFHTELIMAVKAIVKKIKKEEGKTNEEESK